MNLFNKLFNKKPTVDTQRQTWIEQTEIKDPKTGELTGYSYTEYTSEIDPFILEWNYIYNNYKTRITYEDSKRRKQHCPHISICSWSCPVICEILGHLYDKKDTESKSDMYPGETHEINRLLPEKRYAQITHQWETDTKGKKRGIEKEFMFFDQSKDYGKLPLQNLADYLGYSEKDNIIIINQPKQEFLAKKICYNKRNNSTTQKYYETIYVKNETTNRYKLKRKLNAVYNINSKGKKDGRCLWHEPDWRNGDIIYVAQFDNGKKNGIFSEWKREHGSYEYTARLYQNNKEMNKIHSFGTYNDGSLQHEENKTQYGSFLSTHYDKGGSIVSSCEYPVQEDQHKFLNIMCKYNKEHEIPYQYTVTILDKQTWGIWDDEVHIANRVIQLLKDSLNASNNISSILNQKQLYAAGIVLASETADDTELNKEQQNRLNDFRSIVAAYNQQIYEQEETKRKSLFQRLLSKQK